MDILSELRLQETWILDAQAYMNLFSESCGEGPKPMLSCAKLYILLDLSARRLTRHCGIICFYVLSCAHGCLIEFIFCL